MAAAVTVATPQASEAPPVPAAHSDPASIGNAAILNRLNEIEATNQALLEANERLKSEAARKDEQIQALSAEKRKEMEQMIETAIDTWLNSLTGVSEEMRGQFRKGISKIAQQADMKNAAWEVRGALPAHTLRFCLFPFDARRLFAMHPKRIRATSNT